VIDMCKGERIGCYHGWLCRLGVFHRYHVVFNQCPREANKVPHELAKECFQIQVYCNWVNEPPSFLVNQLINDVTSD
jgi:hypothetical protein